MIGPVAVPVSEVSDEDICHANVSGALPYEPSPSARIVNARLELCGGESKSMFTIQHSMLPVTLAGRPVNENVAVGVTPIVVVHATCASKKEIMYVPNAIETVSVQ